MLTNATAVPGASRPVLVMAPKPDTAPGMPAERRPRHDDARMHEAISVANHAMRSLSNSLEFSLDPDSRKMLVRVVDRETRQVIRQFPSEEMLAIARALDRMQGLLINRDA